MDKKKNQKCLLVDDDISFLAYLRILFEGNGFDVTVCSDAHNSVEKLDIESFDLIVTDIDMPIINGFDFISMIKEKIKARNIPVIFVSNLDDKSSIEKAFDLGAVGYFKKPFLKNHIKKVFEILDGSNPGHISLDTRQ